MNNLFKKTLMGLSATILLAACGTDDAGIDPETSDETDIEEVVGGSGSLPGLWERNGSGRPKKWIIEKRVDIDE